MNQVSGFRASPQQAACWSLQGDAASHPYWSTLQLKIDGACNTAAIQARFQTLLETEEILRTRLCSVAGMAWPIQQINERATATFDLCMPAPDSPVLADCALAINLWQVAGNEHVLALRAPATHADTDSLRQIARQLLTGEVVAERLQYADYAEWKNSLLENADAPGVQYWQQQLVHPAPPLALRALPASHATAFIPASLKLDAHLGPAVVRQCAELACTPQQWLLAAWMMLLSRLSGQALVEVACVDSGRGDQLDSALGLFELALPIRATVDQSLSLRQQIGAMRDASTLAFGWRDYHDGAANSDIGFVCRSEPAWSAKADGISILDEHCTERRFNLRLRAHLHADSINCAFDYNTTQCSEAAMAVLGEQWTLLCAALASDCDRPIGGIDLLGPLQRGRVAAPETELLLAPDSLVDMIERQAAAAPGATALTHDTATLTYAAMNQQANQLAHRLIQAGVTPGDIVGIVLPRSNAMIVAILAVLKAGAAYLALDPAYPAERLAFMAQDSAVRHVIGNGAKPGAAPHVTITIDAPASSNVPDTNPGLSIDPALPAYLIYTSGSSGQPKAVEVSHRSLSQSTQARIVFYQELVRAFLLLSSFSFDSSVAGIFWTLATGGALVLPAAGDELVLDTLCDLIERHQVSHGLSLPSLYGALLEHAAPQTLSSIHTWIVAGEACPDALISRHHSQLAHARLVNEYGPTEGGVWASAEILDASRGVSIGRPIPGMMLALINEHGAPAAIGEAGEIYLAGAQLATGYRGHPDLTAASFCSHAAIASGQRAYRTGDLASWDVDGRLHFLGRRDQQVKIRGHRVELAEIERHLLQHGEVGDAVVVAQENAGSTRLLAYFTGKQATPPEQGALRNYLAEKVPAYMVPAQFVALRAMPLTPNGKRDLNALPDPDSAAAARQQYIAPRNALEQELATICAGVLRQERFGVTDNFFQVGGDSILSLQVVTRANRSGITLSTQQVFEYQTVEGMASVASWRQADAFATDVGWLQSWTDSEMLTAFTLAATRYRIDTGEVLAAALARALLAASDRPTLELIRLHDGANEQYVTRHAFEAGDSDWQQFAPMAKAALRRESDAVTGGDACLSVRESATPAFTDRPLRAQAPLQLTATVLPHVLTLAWSADSAHYSEERLHQLSAAVAHGLLGLARHCADSSGAQLQAQDFPAAGLDQDALAELLAELNSANGVS